MVGVGSGGGVGRAADGRGSPSDARSASSGESAGGVLGAAGGIWARGRIDVLKSVGVDRGGPGGRGVVTSNTSGSKVGRGLAAPGNPVVAAGSIGPGDAAGCGAAGCGAADRPVGKLGGAGGRGAAGGRPAAGGAG